MCMCCVFIRCPRAGEPLFHAGAVLPCDHNAPYNTRQYNYRGGSSFTQSMAGVQNTEHHGLSCAIFNQSRWYLTIHPAPLMSEGFLTWIGCWSKVLLRLIMDVTTGYLIMSCKQVLNPLILQNFWMSPSVAFAMKWKPSFKYVMFQRVAKSWIHC